ncbi:TIGR02444 family protein [Kangiella sp. TOML190]|uniref:TIGR02444 family protein n=1 Tax=Kangiella sp. TOML190 TaxID=2931351 RepID=UPI0020418FCD|nr:TIGR02444 family protein [Kangiella sp. TOML190]
MSSATFNSDKTANNNEIKQSYIDQFWQWSCAVYQQKEVAELCLAVQNTLDLNVNYLLLAIWSQHKQLPITEAHWELIHANAQEAEDAVRYIRQKRMALKGENEQAYKQALLIELRAEQQHQKQAIQAMFKENQWLSTKNTSNNNLVHYLNYRQVSDRDQDTILQLGQLVQNISL